MKEIVIIAIDIEATGPRFSKNGIISIGYCAGTMDGEVILKKRVSLDLEGKSFDKSCYDQFWIKNLDLLETLKKEAVPIKEGLQKFISDFDSLNEKYELIPISDNPSYDIGFINYYLDFYLDRLPLNYVNGGDDYRPIFDSDCYSRGLLGMKYSDGIWTSDKDVREKLSFEIPDSVVHDHYPDNDAEYIYQHHRLSVLKS